MGWWKKVREKGFNVLTTIVGQRDSASRIARGVAAGFLAAAFPIPGAQIPLSLLFAWAFRGNKAVSIFPQFISNAGTMFPLAVLQFKLGAWFWPGQTAHGLSRLVEAAKAFDRLAPWESAKAIFDVLGQVGLQAIGPLCIGVLLTGAVAAAASYPLTLVAVWAWRTSRRRRRLLQRKWRPRRRKLALPEGQAPSPVEALAYCRNSAHFSMAEGVHLLVDGRQAFGQMLAAIQYAGSSVDLESYEIRDDATGQRFQQALVEAARRGVRVRLLYDWIGSIGLGEGFVRPLTEAGVEVRVYHPLVLIRPRWAVNRRDHRKTLVVDGAVGFTGGLNIADEYAAVADGGDGWRDTHVRLAGKEVAGALARLFEQGWRSAVPHALSVRRSGRLRAALRRRGRRPRFGPGQMPDLEALVRQRGGVPVQVLGNEEFRYRRRIHRAYLHAIRQAKRYILIENAYFIPDRSIRRALRHAARRGVTVAVAVARHSDVYIAALASRSLYSELLSAGVRLFEWPRGMLHAKTAVIDDAWAIVGTYNFDHRSLWHQLEAVAVVADPAFAALMRDQTLADLAKCHEVSALAHELRPWTQMLLDSAAYWLKYWL
jgi:cardiolipin synthase A/B